jgi:hypothetical protein
MEEMLKAMRVYTTQSAIDALEFNKTLGHQSPAIVYNGEDKPVDPKVGSDSNQNLYK